MVGLGINVLTIFSQKGFMIFIDFTRIVGIYYCPSRHSRINFINLSIGSKNLFRAGFWRVRILWHIFEYYMP